VPRAAWPSHFHHLGHIGALFGGCHVAPSRRAGRDFLRAASDVSDFSNEAFFLAQSMIWSLSRLRGIGDNFEAKRNAGARTEPLGSGVGQGCDTQ